VVVYGLYNVLVAYSMLTIFDILVDVAQFVHVHKFTIGGIRDLVHSLEQHSGHDYPLSARYYNWLFCVNIMIGIVRI
jgi:hypothetical protein